MVGGNHVAQVDDQRTEHKEVLFKLTRREAEMKSLMVVSLVSAFLYAGLARAEDPVSMLSNNPEEGVTKLKFMDGKIATVNGFLGEIEVPGSRSEEHTSELQSLMRISYAVFCWKKKNNTTNKT